MSHEMPNVIYLIGRVNALRMLLRSELVIQKAAPSAQNIINVSW